MTTYQDLIEKVSRRLLSGVQEQTVQLTQAYTAGAQTLQVQGGYVGSIQAGARLSIDLEVFYVTSTTTSGTIGVIGGYEGSTESGGGGKGARERGATSSDRREYYRMISSVEGWDSPSLQRERERD